MYLFIFIIVVFAAIAFVVFQNKESNEQQQSQSVHFDLLDDNGNPIKPATSRVPSGSAVGNPYALVQKLKYFCIKDKGYHVSVWPKDQSQLDIIEFDIAGMSYRDNIDDYIGEFKGTLEAEPTNTYDPNAIKVLAPDGRHVGYVPKDMTSEIRNNATLPCTCFCYIGENDGTYFSDCYILRPDVSPI